MKKRTIAIASVFSVLLSLSLGSCTLSEPDEPEGDASSMRLTKVTSFGMNLMKFEYDLKNRITKINVDNEVIYELSYADNSKIPSQVLVTEYEEVCVGNDKYEYKITDTETWRNIRSTSDHILSYESVESRYYYNVEYDDATDTEKLVVYEQNDIYEESFDYDHDGHLIRNTSKTTYSSVGNPSDYPITTVRYTWVDGVLTEWSDDDVENHEYGKCAYSDVVNTTLQWDPNVEILGPMAVTNLFGKAPSRYFKVVESYNGSYQQSYIQYSYNLMPNGLIKHERLFDADEEIQVMLNYVYESVK